MRPNLRFTLVMDSESLWELVVKQYLRDCFFTSKALAELKLSPRDWI
jgi:hypothetical protein